MKTIKMLDEIKNYRKEHVYEQYTRIVDIFKNYDRISKVKMLDAIYDVYSDYNNIIDICTTRELKYLKMVLENEISLEESLNGLENNQIKYLDKKYDWERHTLRDKFLIDYDYYGESFIPEEILDSINKAIKNIKWKEKKKIDDLNEVLVSYCKMQGVALFYTVCEFVSYLTETDEEAVWNHMMNSRLFRYYVCFFDKNIEALGNELVTVFQDYYDIHDEIIEQRKKQGVAGSFEYDLKLYKTLFYNDFDINNPKIKKFLDELENLPFFWFSAINPIKEVSMLNLDRNPLKKSIQDVPSLNGVDLTEFFKIMDEAMDEMPSGALNGFTPNLVKRIKYEEEKEKNDRAEKYVKQHNACLSKNDAKLFYKIYFALLEFTNKKYNIKPGFKIYNKKGINPYQLRDIVNSFWDNKNTIVLEFCLANPYKFSNDELEITNKFKDGIRDIVIIAKYESEYTGVMCKDKTYMIKGINVNIDNVISYDKLPLPVMTSIIPFKNILVYDSLLIELGIDMGNVFNKIVADEYSKSTKYYHL